MFHDLKPFQVICDVNLDNAPWGPEYEHEIEMEFTPMDPRDFPGMSYVIRDELYY